MFVVAIAVAVFAVALAVAPRDGDRGAAGDAGAPPTVTAAARPGTTVRIVGSQFGRILADGRGRAFYLFDRERSSRPRCYGACAAAWPPVYAKGDPVAGSGARERLIATTRRADGRRQVTYGGYPLYYYVRDTPGVVLCQNVFEFGGTWLVVRGDASPVT
ncbi:COG4315 family predicted lipoprotein [Conexibacter woesei]|uniref:Lipoprotein n=1 Tax=Conexibacter woesei (strain DSM 14684 / CCUG 47730 / CIP 108061 / JCM 11494 / NBRC 100937 / ID131577) TaxID=469383 RepID=D3FBW6_CONWI|nr:hypothetical protein [Conexibacter woesei]ADB51381.1 conserved hypothetical protein [Conexibacter woesei DSM 14684]